jgi:hypothetical protein
MQTAKFRHGIPHLLATQRSERHFSGEVLVRRVMASTVAQSRAVGGWGQDVPEPVRVLRLCVSGHEPGLSKRHTRHHGRVSRLGQLGAKQEVQHHSPVIGLGPRFPECPLGWRSAPRGLNQNKWTILVQSATANFRRRDAFGHYVRS